MMMAVTKKSKKEQSISERHRRFDQKEKGALKSAVRKDQLPKALVMFCYVTVLMFVCFYGLNKVGPQVVEKQFARVRILSEFPFKYLSEIQTARAAAELRKQIPPVYRLDDKPYSSFSLYIESMFSALEEYLELPEDIELHTKTDTILEANPAEMETFLSRFNADEKFVYTTNEEDLSILVNALNPNDRKEAVFNGLRLLSNLYEEGIYSDAHAHVKAATGQFSFFNIQRSGGKIRETQILSIELALSELRVNLISEVYPRKAALALFRILREGIQANLIYDVSLTESLISEALEKQGSQFVDVPRGYPIIQPGEKVSADQVEMLKAYRKLKAEREAGDAGDSTLAQERWLFALSFFFGVYYLMKVFDSPLYWDRKLALRMGLLLIFNLFLIRLLFDWGASFHGAEGSSSLGLILPWFAPVILVPIIATVIVGPQTGVFIGAALGLFAALMQENSLFALVSVIAANITAIYSCRKVQVRASLVRAGTFAGCVMALFAFAGGYLDGLSMRLVLIQALVAVFSGLLTGVVLVGIIPLLEKIFSHTTEITLLELTDYNHPLLRKMQMIAPGSYHHSLMVANLAENAAAAIGANALVSRVCALYHDIGKMVKPEYFTENQRDGINPHGEKNPSMSALIIKSHVKEGVLMAEKHKLPSLIIDGIKEHHGTSIIQFFYYKAKQREGEKSQDVQAIPDTKEVMESTYRYEGPRPSTKESALLMIADSVEAASRSLRKVTPQSIDELIDQIVQSRIDDGQLDNVDLSLKEIARVKESLSFTALNMLHSRVEYPAEAMAKDKRSKNTNAPFKAKEVREEKVIPE